MALQRRRPSDWPRTLLVAVVNRPRGLLELIEAPASAFSDALQLLALEIDASLEERRWSFGEVVARKRLSRALREVAQTAAHTSVEMREAAVGALLEHAKRALSGVEPEELTPLPGSSRTRDCPNESGVRARAEPDRAASPRATEDDDLVTAVIARPS